MARSGSTTAAFLPAMVMCAAALLGYPAQGIEDPLDGCNVVWTEPSRGSAGSMPLGNGDIGLNVWVAEGDSLSFTIDQPLDGDRLRAFFNALPASLLRAKGVLNLEEEPAHRTIYQCVGRRWSYTRGEPWDDDRPHSSLVFIGPAGQLDEDALEAGLDACRAQGPNGRDAQAG